jgi:hypothetical protein
MNVRNLRHKMLLIGITAVLILEGCNVGATPAPTVDVNAINTAIVGTTVAQLAVQLTQTAQAQPTLPPAPTDTPVSLPTFTLPTAAVGASPTAGALPTISFNTTPIANTPVAGFTALPTSGAPTSSANGTKVGCNDASFVDENLKDGSKVKAGKEFGKVWQIQNTGTCTWDEGYAFAFQAAQSTPGIAGYDIVIKKKEEFTAPGHSQSFIIKLTAPDTAGEYKGFWKLKTDDGTYFGPLVYFDIIVE